MNFNAQRHFAKSQITFHHQFHLTSTFMYFILNSKFVSTFGVVRNDFFLEEI